MSNIRVSPGRLPITLDLCSTSALAGCTSVDRDGTDVFVTRNWPQLSTGEELLWKVLAWANGDGPLPDMETLQARLDCDNFRAATDCIQAATQTPSETPC